jgi:O-antigen ligase
LPQWAAWARGWWSSPRAIVASLLWLALWFGINTGPGTLREDPASLMGWAHWARTLGSVLVLPAGLVALATWGRVRLCGPAKCWVVYALVSLAAGFAAPEPLDAAYWAACYLAVVAAGMAFLQLGEPVGRAVSINRLSWVIAAAFLVTLVLFARDTLFASDTGYSAYGRMDTVADMAMSRSSGMARFAAVPGIVALVIALSQRGWKRIVAGAVTVACAWLIYFMQSRGAIVAFFVTGGVVFTLMNRRTRTLGFMAMMVVVLVVLADPGGVVEHVGEHLARGQSAEELRSLTGRTRAWINGWQAVVHSPVWGWGPQADRWLIGEHVHNTYMYALMCGGFVGGAAFVAGLAWAWVLIARAFRCGIAARLGQQTTLVQVTGLMAFFTIRSIPEVCGAMYGVDLMVMMPAILYLGELDRVRVAEARGVHAATRPLPRGGPLPRRSPGSAPPRPPVPTAQPSYAASIPAE